MNFDVSFCNSCSGKIIKVAFLVSQCRPSLSIQLTCGGKHDNGFIAMFLLNPKVNEFLKSANIGKVMHE